MSSPPAVTRVVSLGPTQVDNTPAFRRNGAMAVDKSSRARPNKHQYGWGNLPVHLLHKILSLCNEETVLDNRLAIPVETAHVARAVVQRQWMCEMRMVSAGWCTAVDTHPFWALYQKAVGYSGDDGARPLQSIFQAAREATLSVCVPCRIAHPPRHFTNGRTGAQAARRFMTRTTALGLVATCHAHYEMYCSNCMREDPAAFMNRNFEVSAIGLRFSDPRTGDGQVRPRPPTAICQLCREQAMLQALRTELFECARGDAMRGILAPWQTSQSLRAFTVLGLGRVDLAAKKAVEEVFLFQQTRWKELEPDMLNLQRFLITLRCICYDTRHFIPSVSQVGQFQALVGRVWFEEVTDCQDPIDLLQLYQSWEQDIDFGTYGDMEYRTDMERLADQGLRDRRLWPFLRELFVRLCLDLWVTDRARYGLWVLPSDEVEQMLTTARIHTPMEELGAHSINPYDGQPPPIFGHQFGRLQVTPSQMIGTIHDQGHFFPSPPLLRLMDEKFTTHLTTLIVAPLNEVVEWQRIKAKDVDAAEAACAGIELHMLLSILRQPEPWADGGLTNQLESGPPSDASGSSVVSDRSASPRIELVEDDGPDVDYGIRAGWSSSAEPDEASEVRTESGSAIHWPSSASDSDTLGKCKGDDGAEVERPTRPRLGSGQTSSEGESMTTALVTPDESPSLLAGNIQYHDQEGTVVVEADSTPAATEFDHALASPSSSPRLGKRKSPGDGDRDERPARRRGYPHLSEAASPGKNALDEDSTDDSALKQGTPIESKPDDRSLPDLDPSTNGIASEPSPTPAPPVGPPSPVSTAFSTDFESDDGLADTVPCVPHSASMLGPGATQLINHIWWSAREPLRECQCKICIRSRTDEVNKLMSLGLA